MKDLTGKSWGRFQILEERGRGGMAIVYKAYDGILQRTVALKVLLPLLAANQEFTQRFRREAITAANLRHPNIVVIFDVGSHEQFQYIVMEYLKGPTLQSEIQARGPLPTARVLRILGQLAGALDYAHEQGLVHRDVKPANIIIGDCDHVTLTDFGLVKAARASKITSEGAAMGTLRYMSPEQAMGRELDSRADIYSLGVVVYEMLVGETPFTGTTPYETLHCLIYKPPPPLTQRNPRIAPGVESAVFRALSKDASARFGTAAEFAQAILCAAEPGSGADMVVTTDALRREASLLLVTADGRKFPIHRGGATIGRDADNDVVLPYRQVSRRHAQIQCSRTSCTVMDMGSTNGTFVNGTPLAPRKRHPLGPGDQLGIGPVALKVTRPATTEKYGAATTGMDLSGS
jgi:serine/threonine-protein kinase